MLRKLHPAACCALWCTLAAGMFAQPSRRVEDLASGKILVAVRQLSDPNFVESVVLLCRYDKTGAMGLVINNPAGVPLSELFKDWKAAKGHGEPVYVGGPVQRDAVLGLTRSAAKPSDSDHVIADIHLLTARGSLEQALSVEKSQVRIYLGYSGWGPGQLEREVRARGWYIFAADAEIVFSVQPETIWQKLIDRTELRFARIINRFQAPGY